MNALNPARIAVLGMGNLLYSDDGIGIAALRLLDKTRAAPKRTALIDGSVLGLEAASLIAGAGRLLILDAVDTGAAPGTLIRMEREGLAGLDGGSTVHRLGIADLLSALALMGKMPGEVVLLGVQPGSTKLGVELTPAVSSCVGTLVSACLDQLSAWERPADE